MPKPLFSIFCFVTLISAILSSCSWQTGQETSSETKVRTSYFSQMPPGDTAEVFAPGMISIDSIMEFPCSFSPDMNHMIYGQKSKEKGVYLMESKVQEDGSWSAPDTITFTGHQEAEAVYSHDGSKIFFAAHTDTSKQKIHDLWYVEQEGVGWSEPVKLNDSINSEDYEYFATLTQEGMLYFSREGKIMQAEFDGKDYVKVQLVDSAINNMAFVSHPFVSADGTYMIFDSPEPGGFGNADLYISFKESGQWITPVNLGAAINSDGWDGLPVVSSDEKYLFFCRANGAPGNLYWVSFDKEDYR